MIKMVLFELNLGARQVDRQVGELRCLTGDLHHKYQNSLEEKFYSDKMLNIFLQPDVIEKKKAE